MSDLVVLQVPREITSDVILIREVDRIGNTAECCR